MNVVHSVALFLIGGLCQIGGGYLVWQWWRNEAHWGQMSSGRHKQKMIGSICGKEFNDSHPSCYHSATRTGQHSLFSWFCVHR